MSPRLAITGASIAAVFAVALALTVGDSAASTPKGPPGDLQDALSSNGFDVAQLGATSSVVNGLIPVAEAVEVARANFVVAADPKVYLATLTVRDAHVGDETTPLAIENRLVYVVQLSGLDLRPLGGRDGAPRSPTSANHHELVVFVDASSGEFLVATTVR